jgi:hypothetical protein
MSGNGIASGAGASGSANGATTASGYRVSMAGGALEVSARLATPEELELLVKVLEANKVLWAGAPVAAGPSLPKAKPKIEFLDGAPAQKAG